MKRLYILLLIVFHFSAPVMLAQVCLDTIVARLSTQVGRFQQEKVYLHLDHWQCARGERINYRAYCVDAITHQPMDTSRFVYVELIDSTGQVLVRNKNINDYGCATGYMIIPKNSTSGICYMRAYTRRSAELDARFVSVTPVLISALTKEETDSIVNTRIPPRVVTGKQDGMTLACIDTTLEIALDDNLPDNGLHLVLLNRMIPFYFDSVRPGERLKLDVDRLPPGIDYAIVLNQDYDVVASGCFAATCETTEYSCPVDVKSQSQDHYRQLDVSLPSLMAGEEAQLSIGVVKKTPFDIHQDIGYHLLFNADVPMGTGWNTTETLSRISPWITTDDGRYDLQKAFHEDYSLPADVIEVTTTVKGTTKSLLLNRPIKNATVCGISPWSGIFSSTVSDEHGNFILGGLDAVGGKTEFVIQAILDNGSKDVFLDLTTPDYPPTGMSRIEHDPYWQLDSKTGNPIVITLAEVTDEDITSFDSEGTIKLPNLEVRGFRMGHQGGKASDFSLFSDYTVTSDHIEEMRTSDIENVIRMIPGASFRIPQGKWTPVLYLRTPSSINGDHPAAYAVDGCLVDDFDPKSIPISDIERIDVFKTGSTAIWGHCGIGGVLSIKLKENARSKDVITPNVKSVSLDGIQPPSDVQIDDNGKTLYWNPDIVMVGDDGQKTNYQFEFAMPPSGNYEVVIEGITSLGRTIHTRVPIR